MHWKNLLILTLCLQAAVLPLAQARSKPLELPPKPEQPNIAAPLIAIPTADPFQCDRQFVYRGEKMNCDSATHPDGERLRPLISSVPAAVTELNAYQLNRRNIRIAGYVGTLGLVIAIAGFFISRQYNLANNIPTAQGNTLRDISVYGGIGAAAGSLLFGVSLMRANERHLGQAVQLYNEARPNDPIEIQFNTGITF